MRIYMANHKIHDALPGVLGDMGGINFRGTGEQRPNLRGTGEKRKCWVTGNIENKFSFFFFFCFFFLGGGGGGGGGHANSFQRNKGTGTSSPPSQGWGVGLINHPLHILTTKLFTVAKRKIK